MYGWVGYCATQGSEGDYPSYCSKTGLGARFTPVIVRSNCVYLREDTDTWSYGQALTDDVPARFQANFNTTLPDSVFRDEVYLSYFTHAAGIIIFVGSLFVSRSTHLYFSHPSLTRILPGGIRIHPLPHPHRHLRPARLAHVDACSDTDDRGTRHLHRHHLSSRSSYQHPDRHVRKHAVERCFDSRTRTRSILREGTRTYPSLEVLGDGTDKSGM
jgi:hypothetical protein